MVDSVDTLHQQTAYTTSKPDELCLQSRVNFNSSYFGDFTADPFLKIKRKLYRKDEEEFKNYKPQFEEDSFGVYWNPHLKNQSLKFFIII